MIVKILSEKASVIDNDSSDGQGGIADGFVFPIFDPPGGIQVDDLLVDRMPLGQEDAPTPGIEPNRNRVRTTDRPARRHPVFADPGNCLTGWYTEQDVSLKSC